MSNDNIDIDAVREAVDHAYDGIDTAHKLNRDGYETDAWFTLGLAAASIRDTQRELDARRERCAVTPIPPSVWFDMAMVPARSVWEVWYALWREMTTAHMYTR